VADALLGSLDLLSGACRIVRRFCIEQLQANEARCRQHVVNATASVTALVGLIGYDKATELAQQVAETGRGLRDLAIESGLVTEQTFDELITPESVTRLGTPINKVSR
jgi:aspartate ammonia-lyase